MSASARREELTLRALTRVHRVRNGRLAIDWVSRRQVPRWRMLSLNSQWYERGALRDRVAARGATVPATRRPLTEREAADVRNLNPWRLS